MAGNGYTNPPPLNLGPVRASSSLDDEYPRSAGSSTSTNFSPTSPTSSPTSPFGSWSRQDSNASTLVPETTTTPHKRPPTISQRKVNAHSYCGRHSDEFLFGGKRLRDIIFPGSGKK
ncbi:hypothetical protein VTJ04DRAFT_788 [Mycothermus thermophilus]|uniref:uncharacterized protein n=1 Tax=Humicola insolens TaxID=85995 RepID=UPI003743BA69